MWSDPTIGRLFAEPPERFTAARDRIAADLARSGERSAAREVRALRRPTRRLWILDQLAREHRDEVRGLFHAGAELRRAHAAAVRGEPSSLREADLELSRRLDALVQVAARAAAGAGHPADHALLVGVRSDLRTIATTDTEDAERLRSGTLDHVPRSSAEDLIAGLAADAGRAGRATRRKPAAATRRREDDRARRSENDAARRSASARKELRGAARALAAAERELARRQAAAEREEAAAATSRASAEQARKTVELERARIERLRRAHGLDET